MKRYLFSALCALLLAGCAYLPLRPGYAHVTLPDGTEAYIKQPQNPKDASTQVLEQKGTNGVSTKVVTTIGAAQKDTAREIAARLASLSFVVWIGVAVFLFGAASAFWPPLKLIVGSITTSALLAAAGLVLIVLPTLVVGHEVLILAVSGGVVLLYWFAHRHGSLRGQLSLLLAPPGSNPPSPPTTPK